MNHAHRLVATVLIWLAASANSFQDPAASKARGEELYAQGSYELAHREFERAASATTDPIDTRWLAFRLADTQWRALAATEQPDPSGLDAARQALEKLVRDIQREDERDLVFAEAQESLGDFSWTRRGAQDWGTAWSHYQLALDWWAKSTDLARARERYLGIVWKTTVPQGIGGWQMGWGIYTPDDVIENAIAIAESQADRARAHVLRASSLSQRYGDWRSLTRVPREFEAALEGGVEQPWYDDALFAYAQWMEQRGRVGRAKDGSWSTTPDYVAALKLYQRLLDRFAKGESRFVDQARARVREITSAQLSIDVLHAFLPSSEVAFSLAWRNVQRVDLALYPVDLVRDVDFTRGGEDRDIVGAIGTAGRAPLMRWSHETGDRGDHAPGNAQLGVETKLKPGAYLLEATAGGLRGAEIVLVGDTNVLLETAGEKTLVWVTSATTGQPMAEFEVALWRCYHDDSKWIARKTTGITRADGAAEFETPDAKSAYVTVCVRRGDAQAFAFGNDNGRFEGVRTWRVQAITDRPAYRPNDTVQWKVLARRFDGSTYSTPANEEIAYAIHDPRGAEVAKGTSKLNAFGSAWGELPTKPDWPLGEYTVQFRHRRADGEWIGQATLFRLEEYKLPEFEVRVETPKLDGRLRTFRAGDEVEVDLVASYYSGGPVANATAQVIVHQAPLWLQWTRPRQFDWCERPATNPWGWNPGTVVSQQTLTTDGDGKAHVRFATPLDAAQDFEYRIEARVTDASRREIVGSGRVRVARQSYFVTATPRHQIHRPGEPIEIDFKVLDANEQPVAAEGVVSAFRERWFPIWRAPDGRELDAEAYERLGVDERARCQPLGDVYRREPIATLPARSDAKGDAFVSLRADREGCYQFVWSSSDVDGSPIEASTAVWVADDRTRDLGWRRGELEILLDRDECRAGQDALVMLSSTRASGWVLFCVESEKLHSWQVIEMNGPTKLVRVPLDQRHVPNVYFRAYAVRAGEVFGAQVDVNVPPVEQFLDVTATPERARLRPGDEGAWKFLVRDHAGKPVRAELSFALIDESVLAIQSDYALDPRCFFWGDRRENRVQMTCTAHWRPFAELVRRADGTFDDRRQARLGDDREKDKQRSLGYARDEGAMGKKAEAFAAPSAALEMSDGVRQSSELLNMEGAAGGAIGGEAVAVVVRTDFRATAFWKPDVVTGDDGTATVNVRYPQSLTRWKASVRAATDDSRFGLVTESSQTDLPLTVRLQAPRFFVVGDDCAISGVIDNHTDGVLSVVALLEAEGVQVLHGPKDALEVPAHGQVRVDWHVAAREPGAAKLRATARGRGAEELLSDAMERSYPIYEHGIEQLIARNGKLDDGSGVVTLDVPSARRAGSTRLLVRVSPSVATTMLDALPYLVDYPYGCVEQTMSRFLPSTIVAKTLRDLGLDPELAMTRVFGGVEGEFAAKTHPKGKHGLAILDDVTAKSLKRLYDFQHADGGWGWWQQGESDHFMSAYVVWGLELALEAGADVRIDVLDRGAQFLSQNLVEAEEQLDLQAWMLHALSARIDATRQSKSDRFALAAADNLWAKRDQLNAYSRALFALSAHYLGQADRANALVANLANGATIDRNPDVSLVRRGAQASHAAVQPTAHWGADGLARRWSDGPVETTATVLRALVVIDPRNELIAPTANWLVRNRRGAQWSSTRDTAQAVLALASYLKQSGELASEFDCEVRVNGTSVVRRRFDAANALAEPLLVEVDPKLVRGGANEIEFVRASGKGALYFAVEARFFSEEEPIRAAGNELFVRREYFALVPEQTLLRGIVYRKRAVQPGETLASGTRVETVVTLEAKNDLEYVMLEDLKPAGLEAVDLKSGGDLFARELRADALANRMGGKTLPGAGEDATGRTRWVHRELRDRQVALFLDRVPQGTWELRYEMRAEVPGVFHALPLVGQAMYAPEIRANDVEQRLSVR